MVNFDAFEIVGALFSDRLRRDITRKVKRLARLNDRTMSKSGSFN